MKQVDDWYDTPSVDPDNPADGAFYDEPHSRLDLSKFPSKSGGLPIDVDLLNILAGSQGLASKPDVVAGFDNLQKAFDGTYVGDDLAFNAIQIVVGILRAGVTGLIDIARIPEIAIGMLTPKPGPNMAANLTMEEGDGWSYSTTEGHDGPGSWWVQAGGVVRERTSDLWTVTPGERVDVSAWCQRNGLVGAGSLAEVQVLGFEGSPEGTPGGSAGGGTILVSTTTLGTLGAGTLGWTKVGATWTVPTGVGSARLRLRLTAAATAGSAGWDDIVFRKSATTLPQQFISGLTQALDGLGTIINQILDIFNGLVVTPINAAVAGMKDWVAGIGAQINNAASAAVQAVVDGINGIGAFANSIAAAISEAVQAVVRSIFGDGGTKWGQEVLVASGPVVTGPNDIPLGFGMPFSGKITDLAFYTSDNLATSGGSGATIEIRRNGTTIYTATWPGGTNSRTISGLNLSVSKLDRITFWVTSIDSQMANMSISVVGKYV